MQVLRNNNGKQKVKWTGQNNNKAIEAKPMRNVEKRAKAEVKATMWK